MFLIASWGLTKRHTSYLVTVPELKSVDFMQNTVSNFHACERADLSENVQMTEHGVLLFPVKFERSFFWDRNTASILKEDFARAKRLEHEADQWTPSGDTLNELRFACLTCHLGNETKKTRLYPSFARLQILWTGLLPATFINLKVISDGIYVTLTMAMEYKFRCKITVLSKCNFRPTSAPWDQRAPKTDSARHRMNHRAPRS